MVLLSFLVSQQLLGVEKVFLYYKTTPPQDRNILAVLEMFQVSGFLQVTPWNWNFGKKDFRYHGQNLAMHDCLYRSTNLIKNICNLFGYLTV